jgi:citrate synthase
MANGLEGVVAAETVLSHADGERGIIWVRGHPIPDLVAQGFEATVALMWEGFVGENLTRAGVIETLGAGRALAFSRLGDWLPAAEHREPLEATRLLLAAVPDGGTPAEIAAALPVGIAALIRGRNGKPPVAPDPSLTTAADFLRMIAGTAIEERFAQALDAYMTTVIDNGLSASTFAARVIISTRASLASAVVGAYGAFTGALHGGAPGLALDLLDEVANSGDDVDATIERRLAAGERLMGFGHRVFRLRDPRADMLRAALLRLDPNSPRLAFAQRVERAAVAALERRKPGRRLEANIEMDAALLLDAIGLPRDAFTPVFAMARAPAWIAHALEQRRSGRMIRPASAYVGPMPTA